MAKEALAFAVGLIITIALCYIGLSVYNKSKQYSEYVQEEQNKNIKTYEEYDIIKYDGRSPYGSEVIAYIKTVVAESEIPVRLTTSGNTFVINDVAQFNDFYNPASECYINPYNKYLVTVNRDLNEVITTVTVVEQ